MATALAPLPQHRAFTRWLVPLVALLLGGVVPPLAFDASAATASSGVPARPSSGCSLARAAAPGTSTQLLASGGEQGAYVREIPARYSGRTPLPVVVDLHGYAEPATFQAQLTQLGAYGNRHGFITITPQVTGSVPVWDPTLGGHDMAFIGGLLHTVASTLCVDRNRLYVAGYSDGAFMASAVACQYAGQVAAVAPVSGIEVPPKCHPARRVPVVTFHGTADQFVSYNGGLGPAALNLPASNGSNQTLGQQLGTGASKAQGTASVPAITATWAKRNGCASTPTQQRIASDVTLFAYRCPSGAAVELYRVTGGGHAWPGSTKSQSISSVIGRVTFSISANRIMWAFFQAHPL
jgi:polyhydroxybutyrate depolymerase